MSNYISKVIYDGNTLIDLTEDTVTEESLLLGKTAHGADGKLIVGTLEVGGGGDTSMEDGLIDGTLREYSNDRVTYIVAYAFYVTWLTAASFPAVTNIGTSAFGWSDLITVSFSALTNIGHSVFTSCFSLTTLILRNTTKVCTLSNKNAFDQCYHYHGTVNSTYNPNGLKDGYIYVPASLIDSYKVAANWSTFATQFRALEDFTVDGTTTGELDPSKI